MNHRRGILQHMPIHVGPNMTPMVDIVLCILIFFMLGTAIATPELFLKSNTATIDKEDPGATPGAQKLPSVRMSIKLSRALKDGKPLTVVTAFNEDPLPMNDLHDADPRLNKAIEERLTQRRGTISDEVQVLIVPDKNVPYQDIITIYDYCVKLKFKQVAWYPVK